jgi:dihydrolipoamide dehydrogenase
VKADGSTDTLAARHIVIATGSEPSTIPGVTIDEERIVSSTGALVLSEVRRRMVVIGAGVVGLELGSVWRRLGSDVTVVEFEDRVLPGLDGEVGRYAQRVMTKQGMKFRLGAKVTAVSDRSGELAVSVVPVAEGGPPAETLAADIVLVATGRRPFTDGLDLDAAGVARDDRGRIAIDNRYRTSADGIYAIGDVVAGPMLAHKAEDEGIALADILAGQDGHLDYGVIPNVIYTSPEIASVGRTEEELKASAIDYRAGKFPMTASGRARAMGETDGFAKVLAATENGKVLGVHIVSANASELIAEAAVLMGMGGMAADLARVSHAHPTLSEALREAAMAAAFKAVHV